ncbi:MAG: polymer-forming cytoskeletal protein [Rhodobacterales bacterium]|jgi:cytoskeletal protein CcmA (bactofilin family)|nr:polymer-forming cytoskeletal protein [Rhodobacterales bacterium]
MFTKSNKHNPTPPAPEPAKPQPSVDAIRGAASKPAARAASIICADMKINGSVTSEGALQIDGIVDGDVAATDITIGASGHITGEVKAEVVKVKGRIKGSIRARKVELETGAHVKGDIVHSSLQIQSNAVFEGQVKHSEDPLKDATPRAAASDARPAASSSAPSATPNATSSFGISPTAS